MASLAGMLQARGHQVTGSDENVYPPMCTMLDSLGIEIMPGYEGEHLTPAPDCVVVGNAIPRGNPEVEEMLNRKLLYSSSESNYFIIEGDEYDTAYFDKGPKFMHYLPELAIINNIEFDHADIYENLDAVKLAFRRLMNLVPGNGKLIAGWDSQPVRDVVASFGTKLFSQLETFGTAGDAQWQARDIDYADGLTSFTVFRDGAKWAEFQTPLIGEFNVRNCLAVIVAADAWGVERKTIAEALATFRSVRRRCEVRGEVKGITVIDDFAHHPTAVRETLAALRLKYKDRLTGELRAGDVVAIMSNGAFGGIHEKFLAALSDAGNPA